MDKKNLTLGILFIVAAFATLVVGQRMSPPPPPPAAPVVAPADQPGADDAPNAPVTTLGPGPAPVNPAFAALSETRADVENTSLENEYVTVRLTDFGGAIQDVAFKKYSARQNDPEPFVFNQRHAAPLLAIADVKGLGQETRFKRISATDREVVYQAIFEDTLEVTRRYSLAAPDDANAEPYRIRHETRLRNIGQNTVSLPRLALELGTTSLVSANDTGLYLNVAAYDGDNKPEIIDRGEFEPGFLSRFGIGDATPRNIIDLPRPLVWAAVKNQFFASIYTPDEPGQSVAVRRVELPPLPGSTRTDIGLTAAARFDLNAIPPGGEIVHSGRLYVGPKEYSRLSRSEEFKHSEDKVMQFDRYFFNRIFLSGIVAPILNKLMVAIHSLVGNWGVAIVLMTLVLKFISLPFTLAASKSAKRMAKLSEPMKAIREKYKDNPRKQQEATMALFKEHKVNPAGGCIPILITIPLFVGFFSMLQGTAELRFQSFLWAHDLSAPDTVWRIPGLGFPLNIMPLLMGATMIIQMRLTPTPSTMEGPQATMMKIMPVIFTLFCYNFAAALALYSTVNGLFTIVQQVLVNKYSKDDPVGISPASIATRSGKALKNVTPKKK
jgi:membrane protein insertase, YidC/Oxa1 family, C-terminal domain